MNEMGREAGMMDNYNIILHESPSIFDVFSDSINVLS